MPIPHAANSERADRLPPLVRIVLAALAMIVAAAVAFVPVATALAAPAKHHRRHKHRHVRADAACAGANAPVGSTAPQVLRSAVVCLINQERGLHHLPALQASPLLDRSAQGWTNAMVSADQFSHGVNFASRISAVGYSWRSAGENIATGYATPRTVVRAWMASTGHCHNILSPTYRNVGTGVSSRPVRGFASGSGTWTQDFALGMNQSAPSGNFGPANGCPH